MADNPLPGVPPIESPLFESLVQQMSPEAQAVARSLHDEGFAVIDFPLEDFDTLAESLKRELTPYYDFDEWRARKRSGGEGGLREQDVSSKGHKIARLVDAIAANKTIMALLSEVYGRRAFPFQTLTFPVGTEQHYHTDSLHFSSIPEKFMCGVWLALEDIGPDQGPLVYYPGSHKLPVYWPDAYFERKLPPRGRTQRRFEPAWERIVEAVGIERRVFEPKKGEALIWAANLLHGGLAHNDTSLTRWSHVTHYYFDDCTYVTPIFSDPLEGRFELKDIVDLSTGKRVPHRYLGEALDTGILEAARKSAPTKLPRDFEPKRYLELNPDVKAAGADPKEHYRTFGHYEGRRYK